MKYSVFVAASAESDISAAVAYITSALSNPTAADRLIDSVERALMSLSTQPKRYRLLPIERWAGRGFHALAVQNYVLVYRVDDVGRTVTAIRFFHSTQDWASRIESMQ